MYSPDVRIASCLYILLITFILSGGCTVYAWNDRAIKLCHTNGEDEPVVCSTAQPSVHGIGGTERRTRAVWSTVGRNSYCKFNLIYSYYIVIFSNHVPLISMNNCSYSVGRRASKTNHPLLKNEIFLLIALDLARYFSNAYQYIGLRWDSVRWSLLGLWGTGQR